MKTIFLLNTILLIIFVSIVPFFTVSLFAQNESSRTYEFSKPKSEPVIGVSLEEKLYRQNEEVTVKVWVFFTDKEIYNSGEYRVALEQQRVGLPPQARKRRQKVFGSQLLDFNDLEVAQDYLEKIGEQVFKVRCVSRWLNAVSVETDRIGLKSISEFPFVRNIQEVKSFTRKNEPLFDESENIKLEKELYSGAPNIQNHQLDYGFSFNQVAQINVPALHELGFSGKGVTLCMLDTGYNKDHEAVRDRNIIAERDFVFGDHNTKNEPEDVLQQHDHGTGTFSVAAGYKPGVLIGPAYGAKILLAKTEDFLLETRLDEDNWVAGLEWADSLGADVVNSSLAYLTFDDGSGYTVADLDGQTAVTSQAASLAASRGIVLCNGSGNFGPGISSILTPADADSILVVGAVDTSNLVASFSSSGPTADGRIKPDVVALGVQTFWARGRTTNEYRLANGTSLSTPLVSGAAALLIEAHPDWTPMQVIDALKQTAGNASNPNNERGWGLIDAYAAATAVEEIKHPLPFSLILPNESNFMPSSVELSWRSSADPNSSNPVSYEVALSVDENFTNAMTFTSADTGFSIDRSLLGTGVKYFWKVTATDIEGLMRESREVLRLNNVMAYSPSYFTQITTGALVEDREFSTGCSWGDYNNDGYMDLMVSNFSIAKSLSLYTNNGDGTFTKFASPEVDQLVSRPFASTWGDFNNDGYLDVYVSVGGNTGLQPTFWMNLLYQNIGPPNYTFTRITTGDIASDSTGTWSSSFVDYDNDGDLDIYSPPAVRGNPELFYVNDGNGIFTKANAPFISPNAQANSGVGSWIDYDNDGDQDLFIPKSGSDIGGEVNSLFQNLLIENGNLDFLRITSGPMVSAFDFGFSASWGDYDNDGDPDVYLSVFNGNNVLYRNDVNDTGLFAKVTDGIVVKDGGRSIGSGWADYDNDGDLDLFVASASPGTSSMYENDGAGNFTRLTHSKIGNLAINTGGANGCAWADYDNDGDLDLYIAITTSDNSTPDANFLYRNEIGNDNRWLTITCEGVQSNKSAIGTKVWLKANIFGRSFWQLRHVSGSPTGDRSHNSQRVHFGLGAAAVADSIRVEWPSGQIDVYTGIHSTGFYRAVEGISLNPVVTSVANNLPTTGVPADFTLQQNYPNPFNPLTNIAYELSVFGSVELRIYNLIGQEIRTLVDAVQSAGAKTVVWNGKDNVGRSVSSGIYLYRLKVGKSIVSKKMLLLK